MPEAVLGIDIGTASTKAILFDLSGAEVATASRAYPLLTPQPGWVEQDPEQVWDALVGALRDVVSRTPGWRIAALALAAQAGSIIPALENGDPAYPMITWLDSRSEPIVARWRDDGTAGMLQRLSGWHPFPGLPLPSIAWLREARPDVHARARRYLGAADFLIHRLTGNLSTDLSAAAEMLMVDVETGQWRPDLCALGGVDPAMQAALGWSGRSLGGITPEVARLTGLPAGTPVIAGGGDQPCATLAMGATGPGRVTLATGTAWVITGVVESPQRAGVPSHMDLSFHAMPDRWTISQFLGGFGATVDWWLAQAWQSPDPAERREPKALYRYMDAALSGENSAAGSHGLLFLPLSGPSQVAHGKPGGAFVGLQLLHSRTDMARAILEGCAHEVRWALEQLGASGLPVTELWVSGGATSSPTWPQILADVAGVPIVLADYANWAALGAAALAGWGVGAFPSLGEGIARLQPPVRRLEPDPAVADVYAEAFAAYQQSALALIRR
jgi:sugar (pentulose or hexulose) kinase